MDDLLAQMKAEFTSKIQNNAQNNAQNVTISPSQSSIFKISKQKSSSVMNNSNFSSSSMDQLLSEIKTELTEEKSVSKIDKQVENLIKADLQNLNSPVSSVKSSTNQNVNYPVNNYLLNDLKNEFIQEQQKVLEEQRKEEQLKLEEARKLEQLKAERKRKALTDQAKEWLKNLKPKSEEGMWFEEFSYGYETKLEAAIDYMEALKEVRF